MVAELTRRDLLRAGATGSAAIGLGGLGLDSILERALAAPHACGRLSDIEHVVFFIQENRSFDHYFGTYRGVRGFGDPHVQRLHDGSGLPVFAQPSGSAAYGGHLYPFHIDSYQNGDCTNDVPHTWGPHHRCWNGGAMDGFLREQIDAKGVDQGAITMGHYTRNDLSFYYKLADAFTLCDKHHCSVIGGTLPNQLYIASATLDPDGHAGGPQVDNPTAGAALFTWRTMPEQLRDRGISWAVYASPDNQAPSPDIVADSPFLQFKQYFQDPELGAGAFTHSFPQDFQADAAAGRLPQVSWVYAPGDLWAEHAPEPITWGEYASSLVVGALVANPDLWAKTALFITWDENGGFFDHVPPPTAPPGTPGEYLTVPSLPAGAQGIPGPIGLGFRVPLLVVSPFSRGGFVCSDTSDHTSLLRFLETRFGVAVPNLSHWRRSVTGDLTSAFNFIHPDNSVPDLSPQPSLADPRVVASDCALVVGTLTPGVGTQLPAYPVPTNSLPHQDPGIARRPSGLDCTPRSGQSAQSIRLTVSPRRAVAGRRTQFVFHATTVTNGKSSPVANAKISFAGRRARTDRRGRATIRTALRRRGSYRATARKAGLRNGHVSVHARARRRRRTNR
jgi:phospholipase C